MVLDDLRQSPYSARIEFEKVYTNPADHTELKRERWTATVTYVFRENVKNSELAVNPLGLTIVRFRADQALSLIHIFREGTYIIPKIMDSGYVELGKKKMEFTRKGSPS